MKTSGADILLKCFLEKEVDTVFGYPGGAVMKLYDSLLDYTDSIKHIRTSHEQAAVHAADGYARATGKVGVCITTSGPGATNTVTGIANAYMDSIPIVIITAQVPSSLLGKDSFQEIDITGITLSITKHNYLVNDVKDLADITREAFEVAQSGRPGPVLIDIPKDIFMNEANYEKRSKPQYFLDKQLNFNKEKIIKASKYINSSNKPVIYAGGGVITSNTSDKLIKLAKKCDIPVVNTLMGLGSFPRDDKLSLGMVGMHGLKESNIAVTNSDLIVAIGSRFSDRVIGDADKFASKAKIIHIDIDKTEIGKNKGADLSILGDMSSILDELISYVNNSKRDEWLDEIYKNKTNQTQNNEFSSHNILREVNNVLDDVIVTTDVGQHQMWTGQKWMFKEPRTFITSGGLGTMGFGLGAAIGAKVGREDKRVVLITGDGSFRMNSNELAVVSRYNIPIIIVLFNNNTLGMVRQWQKLFFDQRYSSTDVGNEVDYIKLASAYGINGYKTDNLNGLKDILSNLGNIEQSVLIECKIDKNEDVYPIVPPGNGISEMINNN